MTDNVVLEELCQIWENDAWLCHQGYLSLAFEVTESLHCKLGVWSLEDVGIHQTIRALWEMEDADWTMLIVRTSLNLFVLLPHPIKINK